MCLIFFFFPILNLNFFIKKKVKKNIPNDLWFEEYKMKHKSGINDLYIINSYNTILYCTKKKKKKIQESMHMFHKI